MITPKLARFRPSGHSDDWTIIGEYPTEADAAKSEADMEQFLARVKNREVAVDWNADEATLKRCGKRVELTVYTCGYVDAVESVMESRPYTRVYSFVDYQVVHLEVKIPKGAARNDDLSVLSLILDQKEMRVIRCIVALCGKPVVTARRGYDVLRWRYEGDEIFSRAENALHVNGEFRLDGRENWTVRTERRAS